MDSHEYIECIIAGMELYFRTFALASNVQHHMGDIEWICPLPNTPGPSIVFKISLDEKTAIQRIDEIVLDIKAKVIPSFWLVSPTSTPPNVMDLLISKGFQDLTDAVHPEPEPGMALDIESIPRSIKINPKIEVKTVKSVSDFAQWVDVVNEALHGWPMLTVEHYSQWIRCSEITFYLAYLNGIPVATGSTIQDRDKASIEFVATLKEHRGQGAASTICWEALQDLKRKGVKTVTLRSSYEAVPLYKQLGFKSYYDQKLVTYRNLDE